MASIDSHAAVGLEAAALVGTISPGVSSVPANRLPIMTRVGAGRDGLDDVAAELDTAVRDERYARLAGDRRAVHGWP